MDATTLADAYRELESPSVIATATGAHLLYTIGNEALLDQKAIGICGSRHASMSGLERAYEFGREAALKGATVVTGYARGVDRQAHRGALEAGGTTVAVLPEGIRQFRLAKDLRSLANGSNFLAVSMFPPNAIWQPWRAMERNKLIVALSLALFVIEARDKGGTINAAEESQRQGKPVLAVAFKNGAPGREGNQELIQRYALPVATINQLKNALDAILSEGGPRLGQLRMGFDKPS